ncbi:MAG: SMC-Scp complex subunit ScpB [Coxiellaceae bacterium]|nr:SMC-Scp complex subunit ScpB [Coxiellaceae bacterium]
MSEQSNTEEGVLVEEAPMEEVEAEVLEDSAAVLNHGVLSPDALKAALEAAIFASGEAMSVKRLSALFDEAYKPTNDEIRAALQLLTEDYAERGVELSHVASGYRFQAKAEYAPYLQKLWEKKPPRFSRAMLETLALIAYRQPITRGEIEEVRGVSTSSHIMKVLQEREWVKIVAYKDVPGKPALFGTTKEFLDYFDLQHLKDMPDLKDIIDLDQKEKDLNEQLVLNMSLQEQVDDPDTERAVISTEDMADEDSDTVTLDSDAVIPAPEPGSSEEDADQNQAEDLGESTEDAGVNAALSEEDADQNQAEDLGESTEDAGVNAALSEEDADQNQAEDLGESTEDAGVNAALSEEDADQNQAENLSESTEDAGVKDEVSGSEEIEAA